MWKRQVDNVSDTLKYIGNQIRFFRNKKELTLEELSNQSNLTKTYLAQIERGEVNVSIRKLESICNALHISLGDIFPTNDSIQTKINSSINKEFIIELIEICIELDKRDLQLLKSLGNEMRNLKKP